MAETAEEKVWVNTQMEPDLVEKLDEMVQDHGSDRAKFIRLLVRERYLEFTHVKGIRQRVEPKVKEVAHR